MPQRLTLILIGAAVVAFVGYWLAFGPDLPQPGKPYIASVVPSIGREGTSVTIEGSGFESNNDVGFSYSDSRYPNAYINQVTSTDGTTLRFTIPDVLGACALTSLKGNVVCQDIGLRLPEGPRQIFVVNKDGESNKKIFTFLP